MAVGLVRLALNRICALVVSRIQQASKQTFKAVDWYELLKRIECEFEFLYATGRQRMKVNKRQQPTTRVVRDSRSASRLVATDHCVYLKLL